MRRFSMLFVLAYKIHEIPGNIRIGFSYRVSSCKISESELVLLIQDGVCFDVKEPKMSESDLHIGFLVQQFWLWDVSIHVSFWHKIIIREPKMFESGVHIGILVQKTWLWDVSVRFSFLHTRFMKYLEISGSDFHIGFLVVRFLSPSCFYWFKMGYVLT